jgi:hypothetical protein
MADKCRELRKYIPNRSISGTNNWKNLDDQANTLTACLDLKESMIRTKLDNRLDELTEDGSGEDAWGEDGECQAYDWILENTYDDLVSDDDIVTFKEMDF